MCNYTFKAKYVYLVVGAGVAEGCKGRFICQVTHPDEPSSRRQECEGKKMPDNSCNLAAFRSSSRYERVLL